jgi:DNA polymerase elongation subunit (family B)
MVNKIQSLNNYRVMSKNTNFSVKQQQKAPERVPIIFKASGWEHSKDVLNEEIFFVSGTTEDNKSVMAKVCGFEPFIKLELPLRDYRGKIIQWTEKECESLYTFIKNELRERSNYLRRKAGCKTSYEEYEYPDEAVEARTALGIDEEPQEVEILNVFPRNKVLIARDEINLYGRAKMKTVKIKFATQRACYELQNIFKKQVRISGINGLSSCIFEKDEFKVHEINIDPLIKFTTLRMLKLGSWVKALVEKDFLRYNYKVNEDVDDIKIDLDDDNVSNADSEDYLYGRTALTDIEFTVDYNCLEPVDVDDTIVPRQKVISFDLECYSENHNSKISDPNGAKNEIIQISVISMSLGDKESDWVNYLLTIKKDYDVVLDNVKVRNFNDERSLLLGFARIINELDPDILIGYNILKFDWNYLLIRAEFLGIYPEFIKIGRLIDVPANKKVVNWSSSAYGEQSFAYLQCQGRLNIDVLVEVERNHKFESYSLNSVAKYFLDDEKKDLTAKQLFKLYKFACEIKKINQEYNASKVKTIDNHIERLDKIKKLCDNGGIFDDEEEGVTCELRDDIINCHNKLNNINDDNNHENLKKVLKIAEEMTGYISKPMKIIGEYCIYDSVLTMKLFFKLQVLINLEQMSNIFCVPISYLQSRGQQIKILAQAYRYTFPRGIVIPFKGYTEESEEQYIGATVIDAVPGYWEYIVTLDFASLYPSIMIANNIDYSTYLDPNISSTANIPDHDCNVMEFDAHRGCPHDKEKRKTKVKKEDIICGHFKHRFTKSMENKETGEYENEGVLPSILRRLLSERKKVKGLMKELAAKQKAMTDKKELSNIELQLTVNDAKQLALKVSANSMYGAMGARTGFMPLIQAAASVTAYGRLYIDRAIKFILNTFEGSKLVYGDTDSCMIRFNTNNPADTFKIGKIASAEVSKTFPPPVEMAFECVYGKFLLLSKKRYIAYTININGEVESQTKKGVVLKRRDNTHYLKQVYGDFIEDIMNRKTESDIFYNLYMNINKLFTRQVDAKDLCISKSIGDVIGYAKKAVMPKKEGDKSTSWMNKNKKKEGITFFLGHERNTDPNLKDINGKMLKFKPLANSFGIPTPILDPLDKRLKYDNASHLLLALKILSRGDVVPPNTRLQYVFLDTGVDDELQGNKIEDYTYYKENKRKLNLQLDSFYYYEKQLIKPISEVIDALYKKESVKFESTVAKLDRYQTLIEKACENAGLEYGEDDYRTIYRIRNYIESTKNTWYNCKNEYDLEAKMKRKVRLPEIEKLNNINSENFTVLENSDKGSCVYTEKNFVANGTSAYYKQINSIRNGKFNNINDERPRKIFDEYVNLCFLRKSELVLDAMYKRFTKVKQKQKKIQNKDGMIVYEKKLMNDILKYRLNYREVVRELRKLFFSLEFVEEEPPKPPRKKIVRRKTDVVKKKKDIVS